MPEEYLDPSFGGVGDLNTLMNLYEEQEQEIEELRQHDYDAAEKEALYWALVTAKTEEMRMRGVPVTIIDKLCRGQSDVLDAFVAWKKAVADSNASKNLILYKRDKARTLDELIKREWYRPSNA